MAFINPVSLEQHVREGLINAIETINSLVQAHNDEPLQPTIYAANAALGTVASGTYEDFSFLFPSGMFTATPTVVATLYSSSENTELGSTMVAITSNSVSGFSVRVFNDMETNFTPALRYIAVQMPALS